MKWEKVKPDDWLVRDENGNLIKVSNEDLHLYLGKYGNSEKPKEK